MAFRKHIIMISALLCLAGLLIGCGDENTVTAPIISDEAPILPPSNVSVERLSSGHVALSWDASTQTHWKGYNVYRAVMGSDAIGRVNPELLTTNSYIDRTIDGRSPYQYWVTSVSAKNNESSFSPAVVYTEDVVDTRRDRDE